MLKQRVVDNIKDYLSLVSPESKVYIGTDSVRNRQRDRTFKVTYVTAVVVHINNSHGCRVFTDWCVERDFDKKQSKPSLRMMSETYKTVEAYQQLEEFLVDREVEIHLDISPYERYGSNSVAKQAQGYAFGVTGRTTLLKPNAFAASFAADRLQLIKMRGE